MIDRRWIAAVAGCVLVLLTAGLNTQEVITYGINTPDWNLKLHATATRGTCTHSVDKCLVGIDSALRSQHTSRFYLNLLGGGQSSADQAAEYSLKSSDHPRLYEVGIDDFYTTFRKWCRADGVKQCQQQLNDVVGGVKSANPKLKFGITLYDDKLNLLLHDPDISSALRAKFDTIHFYLHFRQNETKLSAYISTLKKAFPHAKIVLGLYPYDRVEYLPCKQGGSAHCTPADDKALFEKALKQALQMSKSGQIAGIEFYPGNFGNEAKWKGWKNKRVCSPGRKSVCIENTKDMHDTIATTIAAAH